MYFKIRLSYWLTFEFGSIFWVLTYGRFVSGLFERRLIDSALWGGFFSRVRTYSGTHEFQSLFSRDGEFIHAAKTGKSRKYFVKTNLISRMLLNNFDKGQLISKSLFIQCLHFLPKNERKKSSSSKIEFVRSFFGKNVGLKKSFRICLTFICS